MEVIRGEYEEQTSYELEFFREANGGFAFPCDEHGRVLDDLNECARKNYEWCLQNPAEFPYSFNHVKKTVRRWRNPNHGICKCGEKVWLTNEYMGACSCPKCGQWYSLSGQELLPPKMWEEDW